VDFQFEAVLQERPKHEPALIQVELTQLSHIRAIHCRINIIFFRIDPIRPSRDPIPFESVRLLKEPLHREIRYRESVGRLKKPASSAIQSG
jgi:hypothetical protein